MNRFLTSVLVISSGTLSVMAGWDADGTNTYLNPVTSSVRIGENQTYWPNLGQLFLNIPANFNKPAGLYVLNNSTSGATSGISSIIPPSASGNAIFAQAGGPLSTAVRVVNLYSNTIGLSVSSGQVDGQAVQVDQGNVSLKNCKTTIENSQNNSDPVFSSTYTGTSAVDKIAIQGTSAPLPNYGIGGRFTSGWRGIEAYASSTGSGSRYGGCFYANGGEISNYGIYSSAYGTNSYAGYFEGNVYVSGQFTNPSDGKFKKNITNMGSVIEKIKKVRPVSYEYDVEKYSSMGFAKGKKIGVVAQELAEVFPELVTDEIAPNMDKTQTQVSTNFKSVNYLELIPILTKAIQEQQDQIDKLQKEIRQLRGN